MAKKASSSFEQVIKDFRLRSRTDVDGTTVVFGKLGQLYEDDPDEGTLGAIYMAPDKAKGWKVRREAFLAAGATLHQNGDNEGSVIFPANDSKLIRLACRLLRIPNKRSLSPERREQMIAVLAAAREKRQRQQKEVDNTHDI